MHNAVEEGAKLTSFELTRSQPPSHFIYGLKVKDYLVARSALSFHQGCPKTFPLGVL